MGVFLYVFLGLLMGTPSWGQAIPLEFSEPQGKFQAVSEQFPKFVSVFGVAVIATRDTPDDKVLHTAAVLAQYLDNDEDGVVDNKLVAQHLTNRNAFMFLARTEAFFRRFDFQVLERADLHAGQSQFATETNPGGRRFDATLEEVLHLVTDYGYGKAYPSVFGRGRKSELAKCLNRARGGYFREVPQRYPQDAWFTYDDRTCNYKCQLTEYLYWAITSVLGAQKAPWRAAEIRHEWRLSTPELVAKHDPWIHRLITDPKYQFPSKIPNGRYGEQNGL